MEQHENRSINTLDVYESSQNLSELKAFLAREFLMWLWFQSETESIHDGLYFEKLKRKSSVVMTLEDRLTLESTGPSINIHSIKGGAPSRSPEARSALINGKVVRELRLHTSVDGAGEFAFTLSTKDLSPKNLVLPIQSDQVHEIDLAHRLKMTEIIFELIDLMFLKFLDQRTDSKWNNEFRQKIEHWKELRGNENPELH